MASSSEASPYSQAPEPFLQTLRGLAECYQMVFRASARHVESLGLTPPQFDVVATLGDTPGMTCKQLGAGTLITKGTLTGVLDRLESRGLVSRTKGAHDSRQIFVALTSAGDAVFRETFQDHIDFLGTYFEQMAPARQAQLVELLGELTAVFGPSGRPPAEG
jgi:MarR family 2-MHQ and catechol resistance regulon transcriptional repressor